MLLMLIEVLCLLRQFLSCFAVLCYNFGSGKAGFVWSKRLQQTISFSYEGLHKMMYVAHSYQESAWTIETLRTNTFHQVHRRPDVAILDTPRVSKTGLGECLAMSRLRSSPFLPPSLLVFTMSAPDDPPPARFHHGNSIRTKISIYDLIMSQPPLTSLHYSAKDALHRQVSYHDDKAMGLSRLTRQALPFFQPWYPSAAPAELPPDFTWVTNSCAGKSAIGVFGGGCMGLLMGVFLGAMSDATPPLTIINGKEVPTAPLKEQMKLTMRATAEKSMYWCRNFAFITGVFGGSECLVEKYRGKHDIWNPVFSGCITGAALQAKSGPQAAALGCGGFAAFSLVIDTFMGHY